ncbi:hypothetical protein PIB30_100350 [Stylosanthes scabra]|uniref:Uncharacterized protein n=1 Tax=Stylosanthes scabra TaxID=79078 RepID=A0ABU6RXL5_9FABA|nr:hypothetical protein [Stylosanthes scabra]
MDCHLKETNHHRVAELTPIRMSEMLDCTGAYAPALISTLGVPPKAIAVYTLALGCVCTGSRNGLLGFVCDLLVPLALFNHFRSELCLLKLETLECTHQGIVRNGKWFKTQ